MKAIFVGTRLALRAIRRNLLRASLTVLGILIAVASVIAITALGAGARDSMGQKIESLGSNIFVVVPRSTAVSGAQGAEGSGKRLSDGDGQAIAREATSVKAIAPFLGVQGQVVYGDRNWNTEINGTTQPILEVANWHVEHGQMWNDHEEATKAKVCVLGSTVARTLFGTADAVGQTIRIGRYPFRVSGVFKSKGEAPMGGDQDDIVMMPIGSMRGRILKSPPGYAGILLASATSGDTTDRAVDQVESIIRQRHLIADGARADFEIHTQKEWHDTQAMIYDVITGVLAVIAAISLIVGGIGVMNIMLVSVTERTREIGIRMAIGAQERDIRTQFLVEAVVLALIGGVIGALLGALIVVVAAKNLEWEMHISPVALIVSLAVSGLTGVTFGFFPARRAAKLDPIVALRYE